MRLRVAEVPGGTKQPYAIVREDGEVMAFAGFGEGWSAPDGETVQIFVITTDANAEIAALDDRIPVILEQEHWPVWLGEVEGDLAAFQHPAPDHTLRACPISKAINTPRNKGPDLLDELASKG
jgi:putative SOS response-associated peptidase YedK